MGQDLDETNTSKVIPTISMHALLGHNNSKTLRIMGKIKNKEITIQIDSGRTHNFIQEIACFLNLQVSPANNFHVIIGNRDQLACSNQCLNVLVILNNTLFHIDFSFYQSVARNLVLGVQWLKTLGPTVTHYETLQM